MAIFCHVVVLAFILLTELTSLVNAEKNRHYENEQDIAILRDLVYELRNALEVQTSRVGRLEQRLLDSERKISLLLNDKKRDEIVIDELKQRVAKVESQDFSSHPRSEFKHRGNSSTEIHGRLIEEEGKIRTGKYSNVYVK
jgi:pantothenate synthetase